MSTAPELYSTLGGRDQHYDGVGEGGEGGEGEGNDTLTALEASFETRRDMLRSKRDGRTARGLSFLADDIVDRFHKVAVSKHRVSQEEQTVIDDQFFRHSFVYPDFTSLDSGLQEFIAADLIDISLRNSLEKTSESPQSLSVCVCGGGGRGGQVFLEDIYSQGCIQRGGGAHWDFPPPA